MSTPTLTPEKRDELRRLLTAPRGVDPVTSAALALLDALDAAEGERDEAHQILDTAYVPRRDGNQEDGPILSLKERI